MNILGYEFKVVEGYPEEPQDNTVYVWQKGGGNYWKARCYFGWFNAESFAAIDYQESKYRAIINAMQDVIEMRLQEDMDKAYKELSGGKYETI